MGVQISGRASALGSVLSSFWTTTRNSKCRIVDANTWADPGASKRLDGLSLLSLHGTPFDPKAQAQVLANRTWGYCGWAVQPPPQCHTEQSSSMPHSWPLQLFSFLSQPLPLIAAGGKCGPSVWGHGVMLCITGEHLTASVYQAPSWQPRTSTHGGEHAPSDNDIPTGNSYDCLEAGSQYVIDSILCGDFLLIPQRTRGLVS